MYSEKEPPIGTKLSIYRNKVLHRGKEDSFNRAPVNRVVLICWHNRKNIVGVSKAKHSFSAF